MTPFEITVLLHYATTIDLPYPTSSEQLDVTEYAFRDSGYLEETRHARYKWRITDKGRFYVEALKNVPEPTEVYVIEEQPEREFREGDQIR